MARQRSKNIDAATKDRIAQLLTLDIPVGVIAKRLGLSDSTIRKYRKVLCQS